MTLIPHIWSHLILPHRSPKLYFLSLFPDCASKRKCFHWIFSIAVSSSSLIFSYRVSNWLIFFIVFWKFLPNLSLNISFFFSLIIFLPSRILITHILDHLILSHSSWILFSGFLHTFFSLCLHLSNFYCPIFRFCDSFLGCVESTISLSKAFFSCLIVFFISRISIV